MTVHCINDFRVNCSRHWYLAILFFFFLHFIPNEEISRLLSVVYLSVYNKESIYLYLYDITIYHVYNVPSTKVATLYDKTLHM